MRSVITIWPQLSIGRSPLVDRTRRAMLAYVAAICALFAFGSASAEGPISAPDSSYETRVREFVQGRYIHGVPYGEAHTLGPRAMPILTALLASEDSKSDWRNIIVIIGFIGTPEGFEPLRAFVEDRFKGEVDLETFRALNAAQASMGPVARHTARGVKYLEDGVNPAHWATLPWTYKKYRGELLRLQWSRFSIIALSHTGTERAGQVLAQLSEAPYSENQRDAISEGLSRHREIVKNGLDNYLAVHAGGREH